ncbi:cytochrome P450 monooxygenase pc-3 [Cyathus striatus]|nr:cytochrome P450 monooxygenase pc-3 [Cyathus striatus]
MQLTPGLSFIAKLLSFYLLTFAVVYGLLRISHASNLHNLPSWAVIVLSTFAHPLFFLIHGYYSDYRESGKAAALGAIIVPIVEGKWPVSISNMTKLVESFTNGYPGDFMWEWMEKYGNTFQISLPFQRQVWTVEPDHIKAILATQFDSFEKGEQFIEQARSMLGTGVFNSDGDMWKFHRTITRPFFVRDRISDFEIFGTHADDALRQAKTRLAEGYPIDFQDLVSRFTLDSASQFLFGHNVHSLSGGLEYPEPSSKSNTPMSRNRPADSFTSAFLTGQSQLALRLSRGKTWPIAELFSDRIAPNRKVVDDFVRPLLERAIMKKREVKDKLDEKETANLLDYLVQQTEDPTILMDELVNLLVAGRDTTASLLTFAVYMMAEHPDMTQRLREEILSKVGPTNTPAYKDIREMKYLRAFLNEVLRLYPAVPFNGRRAKKDMVLHSNTPGVPPLYIPAHMTCSYSVFVMQRRADLWGPDALKFDPDRFIDERLSKYLTPNPFIFCPFNAGPRICLGQQFAYQEASFFLIRLLQQFSLFTLAQDAQPADSLPPKSWAGASGSKGTEKIRPQSHLTMYVKGGLWVRLQEAAMTEGV